MARAIASVFSVAAVAAIAAAVAQAGAVRGGASFVQVAVQASSPTTPAAKMSMCMQEHVQLFDRTVADLIDACARVTGIRCAKYTDIAAAASCWEKDAKPICAGLVPGLADVQRVRHVQARAAEQARLASEQSTIAANQLATGRTAPLAPVTVEGSKFGYNEPGQGDEEQEEESEGGDDDGSAGGDDDGSSEDDEEASGGDDDGSSEEEEEESGGDDDGSSEEEEESADDDGSSEEGGDDDGEESFLQLEDESLRTRASRSTAAALLQQEAEDVAEGVIRVPVGTGILTGEELQAVVEKENLKGDKPSKSAMKGSIKPTNVDDINDIIHLRKALDEGARGVSQVAEAFRKVRPGYVPISEFLQVQARSEDAAVPAAVLNALESTCGVQMD